MSISEAPYGKVKVEKIIFISKCSIKATKTTVCKTIKFIETMIYHVQNSRFYLIDISRFMEIVYKCIVKVMASYNIFEFLREQEMLQGSLWHTSWFQSCSNSAHLQLSGLHYDNYDDNHHQNSIHLQHHIFVKRICTVQSINFDHFNS